MEPAVTPAETPTAKANPPAVIIPPPPDMPPEPKTMPSPSLVAAFVGAFPAGKVQRGIAAVVAAGLPFLAGLVKSKGIEVDTSVLLAAEGALTVYLTQSVINEMHARKVDAS